MVFLFIYLSFFWGGGWGGEKNTEKDEKSLKTGN